jgi:hypothetical protein
LPRNGAGQQGRIILLTNETHNNVIIYSKSGKLLTTWGKEYPGAHGLTLFNENGTEVLFICDNNRHQVIKTTLDGRVLMTLDYPAETGQYTKADEYIPTETAIAANGDIFVADGYGKDFVIQYDSKGKYIRHFGGRGNTDAHLLNAHGVCIDHRDKNNPTLIVTSRQQECFQALHDGRKIHQYYCNARSMGLQTCYKWRSFVCGLCCKAIQSCGNNQAL